MRGNDIKFMANLILIKTFLHRHEAEVAKGLLKERDIEALISADDAGGTYPGVSLGMGNVKLLVQEQDANLAKEFLQVLDTVVDGELWEEDVNVTDLLEAESKSSMEIKKDTHLLFILLGLLILIVGIIYFLKQK